MRKNQVTDKLLSGTNVLRQLMFLALMALCTSSAFAQKQVSVHSPRNRYQEL